VLLVEYVEDASDDEGREPKRGLEVGMETVRGGSGEERSSRVKCMVEECCSLGRAAPLEKVQLGLSKGEARARRVPHAAAGGSDSLYQGAMRRGAPRRDPSILLELSLEPTRGPDTRAGHGGRRASLARRALSRWVCHCAVVLSMWGRM
jgi:hypothetical protein